MRTRIKNSLLATLLFCFLISAGVCSGGTGNPTGLATEVTQILNNLELIGLNVTELKALAQQADQLMNEVMMIENQLKNLETVVMSPYKVINSLQQLADAVKQGNILSYASGSILQDFIDMNPGFGQYAQTELEESYVVGRYNNWSAQNIESARTALEVAGIQNESLIDEDWNLNELYFSSATAEGNLAAVQAGNAIAREEVQSLHRLRQLMMTDLQLQANYIAAQQDKEDMENAGHLSVRGLKGKAVIGNGENIIDDF